MLDPGSLEAKDIEEFFAGENKHKTQRYIFTLPVPLMKFLDYMNDLTGKTRASIVREAITSRFKTKKIIRKLLNEELLDQKETEFLQEFFKEVY